MFWIDCNIYDFEVERSISDNPPHVDNKIRIFNIYAMTASWEGLFCGLKRAGVKPDMMRKRQKSSAGGTASTRVYRDSIFSLSAMNDLLFSINNRIYAIFTVYYKDRLVTAENI